MTDYTITPADAVKEPFDGLRVVPKEEFFEVINPMNVCPRPGRYVASWESPNRVAIEVTTPGYLCEGPKTYQLKESVV